MHGVRMLAVGMLEEVMPEEVDGITVDGPWNFLQMKKLWSCLA
jgi:hypothetical protein